LQISISNEELCVISPDFRKYCRENTITKRIPTVETGIYAEQEVLVMNYGGIEGSPTTLLMASPIDSLRVLNLMINDSLPVVCTLDQGSEIVAMNCNIWQQLGIPLAPDKTLTMESADSNRSTTAGVVEDLKFAVGDIDILLQVHVVDGAPFDILMGRPFFRCGRVTYLLRRQPPSHALGARSNIDTQIPYYIIPHFRSLICEHFTDTSFFL
jgi:hypothetical protein